MSDSLNTDSANREPERLPPAGGNGSKPPPPPPTTVTAEAEDPKGEKSFFDNMADVRIAPNTTYSTRAVLTDVSVRKPDGQEWIRVNSHPDWQVSTGILTARKQGFKDTNYYVVPELREALAKEMRLVTLFTTMTSGGLVFLWPIGIPKPGGRSNPWLETARSGCELAKTDWVRVISNTDEGQYDVKRSEEAHVEPKWPDKTLKELLKLAFKDRVIDTMDHPVVVGLSRVTP